MSKRSSQAIELEPKKFQTSRRQLNAAPRVDAAPRVNPAQRSRQQKDEIETDRWQTWLRQICDECGVTINGPAPGDPQIHNTDIAKRMFTEGSIGLGEGYMEGLSLIHI